LELNRVVSALRNTQPFQDGYYVGAALESGSNRVCFELTSPTGEVDRQALWVLENRGAGASSVSSLYDRAEALLGARMAGFLDRRAVELDGVSYHMVRTAGVSLEGKLMPGSAVEAMGRDICRVLTRFQSAGLVHRNIKPKNIVYSRGQYTLTGYELTTQTGKGAFSGTKLYAPSEALRGEYDLSSDVYSLSLSMYCLLNGGKLPFVRENNDEEQFKAYQMRCEGVKIPVLPSVNPKLMSIVLKGCEFRPEDRYRDAQQMLEDLTAYAQSRVKSTMERKQKAQKVSEDLESLPGFSSQWTLAKLLGAGAYGFVYLAKDAAGEEYALKVIPIPMDDSEPEEKMRLGLSKSQVEDYYAQLLARTSSEALMHLQLSSCPHVVHLHRHGNERKPGREIGEYFWMSMELLNPIEPMTDNEKQAAEIVMDVCKALTVSHKRGMTHRDIKPDNILYSPAQGYKLGDFGVAKLHKEKANATVIGTPTYMAPEILKELHFNRNTEFDYTVDFYALGMTLYTMLNNGRGPFVPLPPAVPTAEEQSRATVKRLKGEDFPPAVHASPQMMRVIARACAFTPADRYQSAEDMREALMDVAEG